MELFILIAIIAVAIFVGIATKKYYDKPYIVNFGIAAMMLLLVVQSILMQPITTLGYLAIAFCSIAFVFQAVSGYRSWRSREMTKA